MDSGVVEAAESVLHAWHWVSVAHGDDPTGRALCRRCIIEVAGSLAPDRARQISFTNLSATFAVGPPNGQGIVEAILSGISSSDPGHWDIRHWSELD